MNSVETYATEALLDNYRKRETKAILVVPLARPQAAPGLGAVIA